jgi:nucleoside-diphosphate-sugar epimerase
VIGSRIARVEEDDDQPAHRRIETMPERRGVLLTGATGLLGQYLLRDLLLKAYPVVVLVRDAQKERAADRIGRLIAFWSEHLRQTLPTPFILNGDLCQVNLGLSAAEKLWLGRRCQWVIHSAANLSLGGTCESEPWRTNVEGTKSLLSFCRDAGLSEWHHVSTAFVCGRRAGTIAEEDLDDSHGFHNAYEESKYRAEQLVRAMPGILATIYRPAVIVGDSRTGYTSSFHGLYRFLELGVRLAAREGGTASRPGHMPSAKAARLPLRLPLQGDEVWNLVCVDWVSQAIVELLGKPQWHGRTFHLVAKSPITTRLVRDIGAEVMNLAGVEFAGSGGVEHPSRLEQLFLDGIQEYWPYFKGNPGFVSVNTRAALPELPSPTIDRSLLARLIRFAVANRWGRTPIGDAVADRPKASFPSSAVDVSRRSPIQPCCAEYIEQIFPKQACQSRLAHEAGLDLIVSIDLQGPGGGQWSCKWTQGELIYARRGLEDGAAVIYHSDPVTFQEIVSGSLTPQEAFFDQRVEMSGDLETGLKLAVLFGQFLAERLDARPQSTEVMDAIPLEP